MSVDGPQNPPASPSSEGVPRGALSRALNRPVPGDHHVLYPDRYAWYILASSLDIMLTVKLLVHLGAREVNTIAQASIDLFGTWGLIGLKFISVVLVILICEYVGRRNIITGRRLATAAIGISLIPISAALVQVVFLLFTGDLYYVAHPAD